MALWPTITDDNGTGTTGTIMDADFFEAIKDYMLDGPYNEAYNSGHYTTSGSQVWTVQSGDLIQSQYFVLFDRLVFWTCRIANSVLSGSPEASTLRVRLPGGFTGASPQIATKAGFCNISGANPFVEIPNAQTYAQISRSDGATWDNAASLYLYFTILFRKA